MFTLTPFERSTWSILDELESLQEDMNRAFSGYAPAQTYRSARRSYPPVNVWSSEDKLIVDAELPGVNPDDVDISVEGDELTIRGKINAEEPKDNEIYHRRERPTGEFSRTLHLPFRASANDIKANYTKGILRITVPRAEEDKPRKISIEVS